MRRVKSPIAESACDWKKGFLFCNCMHSCETLKDHRSVDLIGDTLPFGALWYAGPNAIENAIGYALHRSRSHNAVIRVYDGAGRVIETHEHKGDFKKP